MIQKESLIKIIPKTKPKEPVWMNWLIGASLTLMVVVLAVFFFFKYQKASLEGKQLTLVNEALFLEKSDLKAEEARLLELSGKIKEFSRVFKKHQLASEVFFHLKKNCHPEARFESVDFGAVDYYVNITGVTLSFKTLGEQLLILEKNANISNLSLKSLSLSDEGRVSFEMSFNLSPALFKLSGS